MKDKKAQRYLTFYGNERPISAQLFGSDPATLSEAAKVVQDLGFDLGDPQLRSDGLRGLAIVAREHDDSNAVSAQAVEGCRSA